MGTDRSEVYSGPCPCGTGKVTIDYCTPDHGWPTSTPYWHSTSLDCAKCGKQYQPEQRKGSFVLVEQVELDKREKIRKQARGVADALMKDPKVTTMVDTLVAEIDKQPSKAAIHRLLTKAGLESSSVESFRRHWSCANRWVKTNISAHRLAELMKATKTKDAALSAKMAEMTKLYEAADEPAPIAIKIPYEGKALPDFG